MRRKVLLMTSPRLVLGALAFASTAGIALFITTPTVNAQDCGGGVGGLIRRAADAARSGGNCPNGARARPAPSSCPNARPSSCPPRRSPPSSPGIDFPGGGVDLGAANGGGSRAPAPAPRRGPKADLGRSPASSSPAPTNGGSAGATVLAGQAEYRPGENDRLPWVTDGGSVPMPGDASAESRPRLVYLYSSGDTDHDVARVIERGLFRDRAVVQLASAFACYKVDRDGFEGRALIERLGLADRPTVLFLDPAGREVARVTDAISAKQLLTIMTGAGKHHAKRLKLTRKAHKDIARAADHRDRGNLTMAKRLLGGVAKKRDALYPSAQSALDAARQELEAALESGR